MPGKSITRLSQPVFNVNHFTEESGPVPLISDESGDYVRFDDHLAALGEAEKERDEFGDDFARRDETARVAYARLAAEEQHRLEVQRACISANQSLQTLRLALEAEVERLRNWDVKAISATQACDEIATRLQQLLDQPSETAGES